MVIGTTTTTKREKKNNDRRAITRKARLAIALGDATGEEKSMTGITFQF